MEAFLEDKVAESSNSFEGNSPFGLTQLNESAQPRAEKKPDDQDEFALMRWADDGGFIPEF